MKNISKVAFILFIFSSCQNASPEKYQNLAETTEQVASSPLDQMYNDEHMARYGKPMPAHMKMKESPIQDLKIIKTADFRFQVKDIDVSSRKIQEAVENHSSYISDMNMTVDGYQKNNRISIRVPNSNFDKLLTEIGKEAEFVDYKRIKTDDVSEEYVDIETRLKTKKEVKERYEDMLRNRAKTMQQIFHAEEKIRVLQEEIESKEGRLRFLKDRVAFSTVNLEIYQVVDLEAMAAAQEHGFSDDFKDNFMNGWSGIMVILLALVNIWPLLLIGLAVLFWKWDLFSRLFSRSRA